MTLPITLRKRLTLRQVAWLGLPAGLLLVTPPSWPQTLYYDPVSGQMVPEAQLSKTTSAQELILAVKSKSLVLGDLNVVERNGAYWVHFDDLAELLDFPIKYQTSESSDNQTPPIIDGQGWFIRTENTFTLETLNSGTNSSANTRYRIETPFATQEIPAEQLLNWHGDWLWPLQETLTWFQIDSEPSLNNLTLTLKSKQPLPIEERIRRQNRFQGGLSSDFELQYPRRDTPYQLISPINADLQFTLINDYSDNNRFNGSILGAGDLLYMTGRYYLNYNYNEFTDRDQTNLSLTLERNDIDSNLLGPLQASHVSLGDITPSSIENLPSNNNNVGIKVSNRPYGRLTNASQTNITGLLQPGWDVELYINDIFIRSERVGQDGRYQFLNAPLTVGENRVLLKFYGPQGQREEKTEIINVDAASLTGSGFIYDASFSRQDWRLSDYIDNQEATDSEKYRTNVHLETGLTQNLSLTGDLSHYQFTDGEYHLFLQPGMRLFLLDSLINLNWLKDIEGGSQTNFSVSRGFGERRAHTLSYNLENQTADFRLDATDEALLRNSQSLALQGPFLSNLSNRMYYQLSAGLNEYYTRGDSQNYQFNLGANIGRWQFSHNLSYVLHSPGPEDDTSTDNLQGQLTVNAGLGRLYLRSGLTYGLEPNQEVQYGNIDFLWTFNSDWNAEASYDYSLVEDQLTQGYRVNWQTRYFLSSLRYFETEGNNSVQLNFSFSLGHNPLDSFPVVSARRLANTGSVAAVVYEDLNNDQQRQANEPVIPNAQVIATQQQRRAKTDEDGKAFIPGLYGTTPTDVTVVPKSLEDPFWIPSGDGTAFLPRPGLVKVVEIPIVTAGEVEGQVTFQSDLFSAPQDQGGVPLILSDHQHDRSFTTRSAFDGFFLFDMIPPGEYELSVDPDYLKKHQLASRQPMQVKIGARGTLIVGANFVIYPVSMYRYQTDSDDAGQSFALDFGTFLSEENARMVLTALRQAFPVALGQATSKNGFEVAMQQNQLGQVNLSLAPLQDLDQAKYVCGALASEGLPCQIRPLARPQPKKPTKPAKPTAVEPPATQPSQLPQPSQPKKSPGLVKKDAPVQHLQSASTPVKTVPMTTQTPPKMEGNGFTIQLVSVSSEFAAEEYIEKHRLTQAKIQPRQVNGNTLFAVIYSHYPTRQSAQADAQKLKTQLNIQPWIKPL